MTVDSPRNALARWEQYRRTVRAHENAMMRAADEVYLAFHSTKSLDVMDELLTRAKGG